MKRAISHRKTKKCGSCNQCCISLTINEPGLQKEADIACANLSSDKGCSIYADRPQVCRGFQCGWITLPKLPNSFRPDKCGFMIDSGPTSPFDFNIIPHRNYIQTLTSSEALGFIATCIQSDFTISISVPTKPGHQNAKSLLSGYVTPDDLRTEQALRLKVLTAIASAMEHPTELAVKFID